MMWLFGNYSVQPPYCDGLQAQQHTACMRMCVLLIVLVVSSLSMHTQADTISKEQQEILESMEKAFLGILGLSERPRPKAPVHVPHKLKELYEQINGLDQGTLDRQLRWRSSKLRTKRPPGNTVRSHYFTEESAESEESRNRVLQFDLTNLPEEEMLHAAELLILHNTNTTQRINIYQVLDNSSKGELLKHLVDTKPLLPAGRNRWNTFDISPVVRLWRTSPSRNHGLYVEVHGEDKEEHGVRLRRSADMDPGQWVKERPYLVTYTDDSGASSEDNKQKRKQRRTRRSRKNRKRTKERRRRKRICRRHSLEVDFEEVGWDDWIVAPPSYDAFYCHGECPFALPEHLNTTNHAVVQSFVHSMNPGAVPKPCCVPTELSQMSMLYVNNNEEVVLKTYQDMVVEACGCR